MRRPVLALLAVAALAAGCARVPKLSAVGGSGGARTIEVKERGVVVRVLPNAWQGYPPWLTRRYTPLWVSFLNTGPEAFDVTFAAMNLVNERGEVFSASPPASVARAAMEPQPLVPDFDLTAGAEPAIEPPPPLPDEAVPAPPAPIGPRDGDGVFFDLPAYSYGWVPTPNEGTEGRTPFGVSPPSSPFGGVGIGREAGDILDPALHEGRLLPNTHAEGFVYFPADLSATELTFRLQARNEDPAGAPLQITVRLTTR